MNWWRKRSTVEPDPRATEARVLAERDLARRRAETPRVEQMVAEWRRIRERNHLAAAIEQSFRGGSA